MEQAIGFEELRWLRELTYKTPRGRLPGNVSARLLLRGLIARTTEGFELTVRGRIALAKLG